MLGGCGHGVINSGCPHILSMTLNYILKPSRVLMELVLKIFIKYSKEKTNVIKIVVTEIITVLIGLGLFFIFFILNLGLIYFINFRAQS